ncbi:MAG: hypothetical protein AAF570_23735, partial [Bacteroidota bacterium]
GIGLCLFSTSFAQEAQNTVIESEAYQYLNSIADGDSMIFDYHNIPPFCFNGRKNPFQKFTVDQEAALSAYAYPRFISYGQRHLERDILRFQQAVTRWNDQNEHRAEEIRNAVGFAK